MSTIQSINITSAEIDRFLVCASRISFARKLQNVAIIRPSIFKAGPTTAPIKDHLFLNSPSKPSIIIAAIQASQRHVLGVFYLETQKVACYDPYRESYRPQMFNIFRFIISKEYNVYLNDLSPSEVILTTNKLARKDYDYADYYLCRLAEEIIFTGKTNLLEPFNVQEMAQRIRAIMNLINSPNWKGEWIIANNARALIQNSTPPEIDARNIPVTSSPATPRTDVPLVTPQPNLTANLVENSNTSIDSNLGVGRKKVDLSPATLTTYEQNIPILGKLAKEYVIFTTTRKCLYNRTDSMKHIVNPPFNFPSFNAMCKRDFEAATIAVKALPFFKDIPIEDTKVLIKNYETYFFILERAVDTVLTLPEGTPPTMIMLQNGEVFELSHESLIKALNQNIIQAWGLIIPILKELQQPEIIEVMFCCCCLFLTTTDIEYRLSYKTITILTRAKFDVNYELHKFYKGSPEKLDRIMDLIEIIQFVSDGGRKGP